MKKLFVIFFLLITSLCSGQQIIVSLAAGPSFVQTKKYPKPTMNGYTMDMSFFTYVAGLKANISIHRKWEIRTAILLTEKGYTNHLPLYLIYDSLAFPMIGNHSSNTMSTMRWPLSLAYHLNKRISFFVGSGVDVSGVRNTFSRRSYKFDLPIHFGITFNYRNLNIDLTHTIGTRPYGFVRAKNSNIKNNCYNRQTSLIFAYAINRKGKNCVPCNRKRL